MEEEKKVIENKEIESKGEAVNINTSEINEEVKDKPLVHIDENGLIFAPCRYDRVKEERELISKLQKKKNALRKLLHEKGTLKKDKKNKFDGYTYFSEAQYKLQFTELFSKTGLELKFDIPEEPEKIDATDKQPFAYRIKVLFELFDIDTGYFETTTVYGDAFDKGDKALYKAYTGALKYYLANTFMVATGDEPEVDSPEGKKVKAKATASQVKYIVEAYGESLNKLLDYYKVEKVEDLDAATASSLIKKLKERSK